MGLQSIEEQHIMKRRLEDRIRDLCAKLIGVADESSPEFLSLSTNLRTALKEHVNRLRARLNDYPLFPERRSKP